MPAPEPEDEPPPLGIPALGDDEPLPGSPAPEEDEPPLLPLDVELPELELPALPPLEPGMPAVLPVEPDEPLDPDEPEEPLGEPGEPALPWSLPQPATASVAATIIATSVGRRPRAEKWSVVIASYLTSKSTRSSRPALRLLR